MQKKNNKKIAFLILGSPRSGTSFLSHVLSKHKIFFGRNDRFIDPQEIPINPIFFELQSVNKLNDEILKYLNFNYSNFNLIPNVKNINKNNLEFIKQKIIDLISDEFGNNSTIGIKDPRFSFTYSIWHEVLESLGFKVYGIISFRSLIDTINSNKKSNNLSNDINNIIPGIHYLSSLNIYYEFKNIFVVNYNNLLNSKIIELEDILKKANINFNMQIFTDCIKTKWIINKSNINENIFYDYRDNHKLFRFFLRFFDSYTNNLNFQFNNNFTTIRKKIDKLKNKNISLSNNLKKLKQENEELKNIISNFEKNILTRLLRFSKKVFLRL